MFLRMKIRSVVRSGKRWREKKKMFLLQESNLSVAFNEQSVNVIRYFTGQTFYARELFVLSIKFLYC